MKLTNYEPTVAPNTIQGQGKPTSVPSDPRAFGADTSGLQSMGQALNLGLKMAEDNMTADVTKAMTEYNRRMDDLMYNPDSGLAYLKNENARNVTQQYIEGEKKIRDEVFQTVPKYKKAQDIFTAKADELTASGVEAANKQQWQQSKNYSLAVMNDAVEQQQIIQSHNLGDDKLLSSSFGTMRAAIEANGQFMGKQWVKDKYEEVAGKSVANMLAQATADDNQDAVDHIVNRYGPLANPVYFRQFIANNNRQKKNNLFITKSKELAVKYRNDPEGLKKALSEEEIEEPSTGNFGARFVSQIEAKHIGDSSYMADGSGTTCVNSPMTAAHEIDPNIPVMSNTGQLLDYGKSKEILKGADYLANVQPGDMIVINDPSQSNDADHAYVWTGHGIYNAGGSGGSSYEKEFSSPQDTLSYFGNGVTVAGIVAFSQLGGAGSGPSKSRKLTPAEQETLYNKVRQEWAIQDAEERKARQASMDALRDDLYELKKSGNYDEAAYNAVARKYIGVNGLTERMVGEEADKYRKQTMIEQGVSRGGSRGSGAANRKFKADWLELISTKNMNLTEASDMLKYYGGISDEMRSWALNKVKTYIETGVDMEYLKQWCSNKGINYSKGLGYVLNYIEGEKKAGRTPSEADIKDIFIKSGRREYFWDENNNPYYVTNGGLYNTTSIFSHDESTGVSYIEGQTGAKKMYDKELIDMAGARPVETSSDWEQYNADMDDSER